MSGERWIDVPDVPNSFFDPGFDARLVPLAGVRPERERPHTQVRWDDIDPNAAVGTYGDYLLGKVAKVFPELRDHVLS